jgi:hypothetical protein
MANLSVLIRDLMDMLVEGGENTHYYIEDKEGHIHYIEELDWDEYENQYGDYEVIIKIS